MVADWKEITMNWCVKATVAYAIGMGGQIIYQTRKVMGDMPDKQSAMRWAQDFGGQPVAWENERGVVYVAPPIYMTVEEEKSK